MINKKVSYSLSVLLWCVSAFEIIVLCIRAFQGSTYDVPLVGHLLSQGSGSDKIAPLLIVSVFGWVLLDILFHALRVLTEQRNVQMVQESSPGNFPSTMDSRSMTGRRCQLVNAKYQYSPDKLSEELPAIAALDAALVDSRYSLTKVFVWILPVLGFIGTAWGMSHAIGGFSDALADTSETKVLLQRLGQLVIPSLAHAFAVTILALTVSIIGHFCVTIVQSWEEDVLNDLDRASVRWIGTLPSRSAGQLDQLVMQLLNQTERLNQNVESLAVTAQSLSEASAKLSAAGTEVSAAASVLKESVNAPYNITITRGKGYE